MFKTTVGDPHFVFAMSASACCCFCGSESGNHESCRDGGAGVGIWGVWSPLCSSNTKNEQTSRTGKGHMLSDESFGGGVRRRMPMSWETVESEALRSSVAV